ANSNVATGHTRRHLPPYLAYHSVNPNERPSRNLLALGSAAVLTVYAAGFARTRPAAQRFAVESEARRPEPSLPALERAPVTVAAASKVSRRSEKRVAPAREASKLAAGELVARDSAAAPVAAAAAAPPAPSLPIQRDTAPSAPAKSADTATSADVVKW